MTLIAPSKLAAEVRGSFTQWRRDAGEWLRAHRSELWILTAIWVLLTLILFWLAKGHVSPRRPQDEFLFWGLAKSFAQGDGLTWRGEGLGLFSWLYPVLIAPAFWIADDVQGQYTVVHFINSLMISATIFPGFLLARMMMDRWRALVAALMVVAVPAMNYAGSIATEDLAYPVFTAACGAIVLALAKPRPRNTLLAFALIIVAALTRTQFVILLPILGLTLLLAALMRPSGEGTPYVLERKSIWIGLLVIFLPSAAYILLRGTSAFGLYSGAFGGVPFDFGAAWYWIKAFTADVYVLTAIIPAIAMLAMFFRAENRRDPVVGALLALTLVASLAFIAQVSWFSAKNQFGWRAENIFLERYMFYLAPLYFASFLASFGRVSWKGALASTAIATLIVSGFQTDAVAVPISYDSYGLGLVGELMLKQAGLAPNIGMVLAGVTLVLGLAYVGSTLAGKGPRDVGWGLVGLSLMLLVATQAVVWHETRISYAKSFAALPKPADFITQTTKQPVGMIVTKDTPPYFYFSTEFWNPNVVRFFANPDDPIGTPTMYSPRCEFGISPEGRIVSPDCDQIPNAWVMRSRKFAIHLQDEYIRKHPSASWPSFTLMVGKPPARVRSLVDGRNVANGLVEGKMVVGIFSDKPAKVRVRMQAGKETVAVRMSNRILVRNKRVRRDDSWVIDAGGSKTLYEDISGAPGGYFPFSVRTLKGRKARVLVTGADVRIGNGPWQSIL